MSVLATILLKVKPGTYIKARRTLLEKKISHKTTSGLWDFVVEIKETDLNCDVPQDEALAEVVDKIRSLPDVIDSNVNITVREVSE